MDMIWKLETTNTRRCIQPRSPSRRDMQDITCIVIQKALYLLPLPASREGSEFTGDTGCSMRALRCTLGSAAAAIRRSASSASRAAAATGGGGGQGGGGGGGGKGNDHGGIPVGAVRIGADHVEALSDCIKATLRPAVGPGRSLSFRAVEPAVGPKPAAAATATATATAAATGGREAAPGPPPNSRGRGPRRWRRPRPDGLPLVMRRGVPSRSPAAERP